MPTPRRTRRVAAASVLAAAAAFGGAELFAVAPSGLPTLAGRSHLGASVQAPLTDLRPTGSGSLSGGASLGLLLGLGGAAAALGAAAARGDGKANRRTRAPSARTALTAEGVTVVVKPADVVGWYDFKWFGGTFAVCFRPGGSFYCPKFQAPARWQLKGDLVKVEWGNFGTYELKFDAASKTMDGHGMPKKEGNDKNWRKASFLRELSPVENVLIGDGGGTEWNFEWSGGSFPVKFKADGYNHFQCDEFPAHSHWTLDDDKLTIVWGEFGKYEMAVNVAEKSMDGCKVGGDPATEWRKSQFKRKLRASVVMESCDHHH